MYSLTSSNTMKNGPLPTDIVCIIFGHDWVAVGVGVTVGVGVAVGIGEQNSQSNKLPLSIDWRILVGEPKISES